MDLTIGIAAGGKSTRMGEDKRFLTFQGRTFLDHALHTFQEEKEVILSIEEDREVSHDEIENLKVVVDEEKGIGPMEAIYQILSASTSDYAFIFPVDMPLITKDVVTFLSSYIENGIAVLCPVVDGKIYPLGAIYHKSVIEEIKKLKEERNYRLMSLLERVHTKYVDFTYTSFSKKTFLNVNDRESYRELLFPIVFSVSGYKKTGKTKLVEALLKRFQEDGYTSSAIKHDGHDYEIDREGTDSSRFFLTGADTAIYSEKKATLLLHGKKSLHNMLKFFQDKEIIIIEGVKDSPFPKIQLCQKEEEKAFPEVFLRLYGSYETEEVYQKTKAFFGL